MATWSVVGKSKKKTPNQPLTKAQKKQFIENMPRIAPLDPVKEDTTIYDAFIQKEQQRYEKKQQEKFADKIEAGKEPNGKGISDGGGKKKQVKKKTVEQVPKKMSFEEAIKQINEADLKSTLLQTKESFPDKPEIWSKNLVTDLNSKLENCPENDNYLKRENTDYPASCLKKGCTKVLNSALADCSAATLEHVLLFCVRTMLDEHNKNTPTHGFRIFLQILIRGHPEIVLSNLSQYKDLVKSNQNHASSCLMLMWALGQVGYPNLRAGIRVWLDIMQPFLGMKALWSYCLQYLQTLLSLHQKDLYQAAGEIQLREYFYLLDVIYGNVLPSDLRKQLKELHPQLKMIAQGKDVSNNLRNFFPSYLTRAKPESEKELRGEVLSSLVECLSKDKSTYSQWILLYSKHLLQTRVLLEHISDKYETLRGRLDLKMLHETLKTFMRTNEESATGRNAADMEAVTALCEDILKKMSKPQFRWGWFMLFLVTTVIGIVAYDIFSCIKLEESRTMRFLDAYGVLYLLGMVWSWLSYYAGVCYDWLTENLPAWESTEDSRNKVHGRLIEWYKHISNWVEENILSVDFSGNSKATWTSLIEIIQTVAVTSAQWCQNTTSYLFK